MAKVEAAANIKEAFGIFQGTSRYRAAGKSGYCGVKVSGQWFNLWGSLERINKMLEPINEGDQVRIKYSKNKRGFMRLEYIEKVTEEDLAKLGDGAQELKGIEEAEQQPANVTIYAYFEELTKAINELTKTLKTINKLNGGGK